MGVLRRDNQDDPIGNDLSDGSDRGDEKHIDDSLPRNRRRGTDASLEGIDRKVHLRERIRHFTWAWFTLTMSTGGFALLLSIQPHKFNKILTIGTIVYLFDITLFVLLIGAMMTRFIIWPGSFQKSLKHPSESLFIATFWLSLPTIIGGMNKYGVDNVGDWLIVVLRVLYWLYCACTMLFAIIQYWYLFMHKDLTVRTMAPSWILPIFPVMLTGTLASILASNQPPEQRMPMLVAGVAAQGLGWTVACMIYAIFIIRLMEFGMPPPNARPGLFICVGPPSFTALALINMSTAIPEDYGYFARHPGSATALQAMALCMGIFIWMIAFWWFCIAIISVLYGAKEMKFSLVWWAMVFPNVGFTISVIVIGEQLESQGIQWVGSIMSILIFIMWLVNICSHARAVLTRRIMMPGQDEDRNPK